MVDGSSSKKAEHINNKPFLYISHRVDWLIPLIRREGPSSMLANYRQLYLQRDPVCVYQRRLNIITRRKASTRGNHADEWD